VLLRGIKIISIKCHVDRRLYTHPLSAWVVDLDDGRLLEEMEDVEVEFAGVEARALSRGAEAVVAAVHAV